jgi:PAS domain S-box-containing protein
MVRHIGKSDNLVILKKPFDNIEVMQLAHALTEKWLLSQQVNQRLRDLDQAVSRRTAELQTANERLTKEIAERSLAETALRLSEERFSKAFKASPIPLAIQTLQSSGFVDANEGFQKLTGFNHFELVGHTAQELNLWLEPLQFANSSATPRQPLSIRSLSRRLRAKDGQLKDTLLSVELLELASEPMLLIIAQDITEQLALENQLRQSQKMEAVGQLAAGVAHDFNNILTVIQGYASLVLAAKSSAPNDRKPIETIAAAAERAGELVRRLLTFSRKQLVRLKPIEIESVLVPLAKLLPRLVPENIRVTLHHAPGLPLINADAGMMEQMLLNLAVNARDAMPEGGQLSIGVELVEIDPDSIDRHRPEARPGRFLRLSVADTGCGMKPEVLSHLFEPFFTTKPVGKGTGLGLATVYGIVKQHAGWLEVWSKPGQGSRFLIYLPAGVAEIPAAPVAAPEPMRRGSETILVVEDEAEVRNFVVTVLSAHGYQTLVADSGPQALERWAQFDGEIPLLLTDMVMPGGLTGRELGERLRTRNPRLKVIYSSGYSPGQETKELAALPAEIFLPKPYRAGELLAKVRECLDTVRPN